MTRAQASQLLSLLDSFHLPATDFDRLKLESLLVDVRAREEPFDGLTSAAVDGGEEERRQGSVGKA